MMQFCYNLEFTKSTSHQFYPFNGANICQPEVYGGLIFFYLVNDVADVHAYNTIYSLLFSYHIHLCIYSTHTLFYFVAFLTGYFIRVIKLSRT